MKIDVREYAKGKWTSILPALGIDRRFLSGKHGPCPICGGKDRYRFTDLNGDGLYICNQCGPGNGFDLAQKVTGRSFVDIKDYILKNTSTAKPEIKTIDKEACHEDQVKLWTAGKKPPEGGSVYKYLKSRLGQFPEVLRNVKQHDGNMIARVTDVDDQGVNIHRTFLSEGKDGKVAKVSKKLMRGEIPKGSAIRLTPVAKTLGVAEGIETALSATILFKVPCWSVLSTVGMVNWIPPEEVEKVIIYGDHDENYAGQAAAYSLANKLVARYHKQVEIRLPPGVGADWNDMIQYRHMIKFGE